MGWLLVAAEVAKEGPDVNHFSSFSLIRAVVVAKDMVPYEENKEKHGKANRKDFAAAMREIAESPRITFTTRPAADPHPGLTTETISETKESGQSEVDAHSSDASDGRVPAAAECPVAAAGKRESKKRKREAAADSSAAKKNKKKKRKSAVSGADDGRQSVRTETGLAEQTDPGPGPQSQPVTQEAEKAADEKSGLDRLQKLKAKAEEKEKKKEELKAEKMMRKRQERLNQLKSQTVTTQMLRDVEAEIIESLSVGVRDVLRCLHAMSRLDLLPVTPALLTSYPDILVTIRKCRKYVHDEQVRKKADYLHYKYKNQFSDPGLDPVVRNKMKAIQMKQNSARGSSAPHPSDPAAGRGDDCSSQSQSPAESDPPAQTLTPASATAASPLPHPPAGSESLAPTESVAAAIGDDVAGDTERGAVESKEEAAVVSGEQRSETLVGVASAQLMTSDDVSPVIAAVVEKITSAVTAAVPAPVVSPALVSDAAARSEVVAVDDETAENKQVRC